jgi:hypothetical protein
MAVPNTTIEPGCLVMDSDDNAYKVVRFLPPQHVETDFGDITIEMVEVTDLEGNNPQTKPAYDLARAEWTTMAELMGRTARAVR